MGAHALDVAPFWPRLVLGLAAGTATWIVAADYGVALVSRWTKFDNRGAQLGVGASFGYLLLGSAVGVLGLLHAIRAPILLGLLALALLASLARWVRRASRRPSSNEAHLEAGFQMEADYRIVDWAAIFVITAAEATAIVAAALPAVLWDPIAYHLPLVASALKQHTFVFSPGMVQTGFPQLGEAAALPAYALAGSSGAAMATLGAGLCLALLSGILANRVAPGSGLVAVMLVCSSPLWLWLAPSFYVDIPFAMFVLAAVVAIVHGRAENEERVHFFGRRAVAGALCGAAAAVKYSGLAACAIVLIFAVALAPRRWWRTAGAFALGAIVVAAGWYIRTSAATGDPLYPFLSAHVAHAATVASFSARYVDMTRHWCGGGDSLGDVLSLPYRMLAQPEGFCGNPGLALRFGVIFAIAAAAVIRQTAPLLLLTIAFIIAWFYGSQQWRFAIAPLATYASLVAAGTSAFGTRLRLLFGLALCLVGAYSVGVNWFGLPSVAPQSLVPGLSYIAGHQTASQYLDERLETYAAAAWLGQHDIPGSEVLALDDVRDYYFPTGTVWGNPYYQQAIALDWQAPAGQWYGALHSLGIRYIVVNANGAYIHRTPTGIDWATLDNNARTYLQQVFERNSVIIYALK